MSTKKRVPITQELIEHEQLVAVGRLAAGVAHEINNPSAFVVANLSELLAASRGLEALLHAALPLALRGASEAETEALQRLQERAHHPIIFEDVRAMVDESLEGMHRIRDIVHNLRGFSIVDEEPMVMDLRETTGAALDLLRPELRHRARLEIQLRPTPEVMAPRSRVAQALMSLLLNTIQAFEGRPRGALTICTGTAEDGAALLSVQDNGRPLPAALLSALDDPFAIPRQEDGGLSLRLATARGIIRRLGGTLEVSSGAAGTTATIRLPAHTPTDEPASISLGPRDQDPLSDTSLLIVDNEEPIVRSLKRLLRRASQVWTTTSGEDALTILRSVPPPDLILCDIIMPELSGPELYDRVCREWPVLRDRFLFITGGALSQETEAFCEAHAARVLEKPFEPAELRQRIRQMLTER